MDQLKVDDGDEHCYIYNMAYQLTNVDYTAGYSQIVAQHDGEVAQNNKYFYLHDRLGSVRQVINTDGDVNNVYTYKPFGELYDTETEETVANPFKFTGLDFDNGFEGRAYGESNKTAGIVEGLQLTCRSRDGCHILIYLNRYFSHLPETVQQAQPGA